MTWSIKYKRSINCGHPKGFSQTQYCRRKARGGKYKSQSVDGLKDLSMKRPAQIDPRLKKYLVAGYRDAHKPWHSDCGYDVHVFSGTGTRDKVKAVGRERQIKAISSRCRRDTKHPRPCETVFNIGKKEPFSADQALSIVKHMKKVRGAKVGVARAACWYR